MSGPFEEQWESFGSNLESFIKTNEKEFRRDVYDVIIGFSRGGTILAFMISCLLKDYFEEYAKPHKASVRPIPKGLSCKRDDPCFVMNLPASTHEIKDINKNLENDLQEFTKRYNNSEPISVLVVDDNLTGATRISSIENKLKEMGCVKLYKKLAYVRNPAATFSNIRTIREFPNDFDYFIMPWHIDHGKKDLALQKDDGDVTKLKFYINVSNEFKLEELQEELKKDYNVRRNPGANTIHIKNGASIFSIKKTDTGKFIELSYTSDKFYPPKQCLKPIDNSNGGNGAFENLSICSLGANKTKVACLICSYLNCNTPLIKKILTLIKIQPILCIEEFAPEGKINKTLKSATEEWFKSLMPMKIAQNKNEL